ARQDVPLPGDVSAEEVRAYYEANRDKFTEPERRRVGAIVLDDKKEAEKVLKSAVKIKSATEWGELWSKHTGGGKKGDKSASAAPADLAGDLGIVGPPDDPKGANPKVPEPLRAAVFKIDNVGGVFGELIADGGKFFIVRMSGITAGHTRS